MSEFRQISGASPGAVNEKTAGQPGRKIQTMKKQTFDQAFERAWVRDMTREPAEILKDIAKAEAKQAEAIKYSIEMTSDTRRRKRMKLVKPFEKLSDNPASQITIGKHREHYDAAAARLVELERELVVSQQVRE